MRFQAGLPRSADVISPAATEVLLAVLRLHAVDGRADVTSVRLALGRSSKAPVHDQLVVLRLAGLVDWDTGKSGTLRPLVARTPIRA